MIELYAYKGCDTCRRAKRWLDARQVAYREIAIRESPPSVALLRRALAESDGELRKLFNTSGRDYREMGLKDRLPQMTEEAALALLSANGNLVKRPFLATSAGAVAGFRESVWERLLA